MTIRCGCKDEGDETVFGVCRCAKPAPPVDLFGALVGAIDRARKARQQDFTLSPPERGEN